MQFKASRHIYLQSYKKIKKKFNKPFENLFFGINSPIKPKNNYSYVKKKTLKVLGSAIYQPTFSYKQLLLTYLGSFLGIAALAYITVQTNYPLIAAPFGATAVLLFAMPDSPMAQPRNLIGGNFIGGVVSILLCHFLNTEPWVMALAVATSIYLMQLTKTLHPPGGAVALVGVMSQASWNFLFTPVLAGSFVILVCTYLFNNLSGRPYPKHWL
jgi:CBS-domain-containing membrane protein